MNASIGSWPAAIIQILVGVAVLLLGFKLLEGKLASKIGGLILAVCGATFALAPWPSQWLPYNVKFLVVIVVFIFGAATFWKLPSKGEKVLAVVLVAFGVIAAGVQFGTLGFLPGGYFYKVIAAGFDSIAQIFQTVASQINK